MLVVSIWTVRVSAGEPKFGDSFAVNVNLAPLVEILMVEKDSVSFDKIRSSSFSDKFIPNNSKYVMADFHRNECWIRFKLNRNVLKNAAGHAGGIIESTPLLIELGFPTLGWIDFYSPETGYPTGGSGADQLYDVIRTGVNGPDRYRLIFSRTFVLPISNPLDSDRYYYLRLKSSFPHKFKLTLRSILSYQVKSTKDFFFYGVIYGIFTCIILYNLFLFLSLRDITYFYYVLYIASLGLFELCVLGHVKPLVDLPPGLQIHLHWFFLGSMFVWAGLFTRHFLATGRNAPFLDKLITGYVIFAVIITVAGLTPHHFVTTVLSNVLGTFSLFLFLAVSLWSFKKRVRQVRFYFVAWGVLLIGMTWWNLLCANIFDPLVIHYYIFSSCTALEAILFSFALGDRIRILQDEKKALLISEENFRKLSNIDSLTSLYNKRFMMQALSDVIDQASKNNEALSLLILDVDDFKPYNDTYGHVEGDKVLADLGEIIRDCIRSDDIACRYGGEEFAVIFPRTELENAFFIAERIRFADWKPRCVLPTGREISPTEPP